MKLLLAFGARPNFMKIAPIYRALKNHPRIAATLVHSGQHFDPEMSDEFIKGLQLPAPDVHLGIGGGESAWRLAETTKRMEAVICEVEPDLVTVVGDVDSTLAAALAASARGIPVAHVEAGLRSDDWTMPEELNRVITDRLSRYLFTPTQDADENLLKEDIPQDRIFRVGNVMIDSLDWVIPRLNRDEILLSYGVEPERYGIVTLHRPSNVDDPAVLEGIVRALAQVGRELPLLFPIHPRTQRRLTEFGIDLDKTPIRALPPIDYGSLISLLAESRIVLTDSGGIQEETTVLGVSCITLRRNTERPITLTLGSSSLVGNDHERIVHVARQVLAGRRPKPTRPPLWDGHAAKRIVEVLEAHPPLPQ